MNTAGFVRTLPAASSNSLAGSREGLGHPFSRFMVSSSATFCDVFVGLLAVKGEVDDMAGLYLRTILKYTYLSIELQVSTMEVMRESSRHGSVQNTIVAHLTQFGR